MVCLQQQQMQVHSYNIGICYRFQAQEEIPAEPFDRSMDEVWTEEGRWF